MSNSGVDHSSIDQETSLPDKEKTSTAVSIRLPPELIQDLKLIAEFKGVKYQPLSQQALQEYCTKEIRKIAFEYVDVILDKRKKKND